jgi:dipeptidyl aminopeptidase/acylaminoacyl peptidase
MNGGPLCYFAWERATRSARYLGTDVGALEGVELAPRHAAFVPARDGLVLPCDVYLPKGVDADRDGRPDRPLPTVLYVHGGPWVGFEWNSWFTNRSLQLLADRGYAVIRTDFRGAAGYGRAFLDAGDQEWGGAMQTDLLDVRAWALEHGIAAAGRVAIWGWSYGGYATLEALTRTPDAFACGIAMYGLSDLERFVGGLTGANGAATWYRRVGDVRTEEGRALLRAASPLTKVEALARPLLVTHGARDTRAPREQSDLFVAACAELEKPVTYVVYPEEPHDYRAAESWISFWAIAEAFLAEHLGGRSEPMGADLAGASLEVVAGAELIPGLTEARRCMASYKKRDGANLNEN